MFNLIITEFIKLKRYSVFWIGVAAVLFATLLAVFQTGTQGGIISYEVFSNNVIWNNFSLAFPFFIVLLGGFLIDREYTDDTFKMMLTVPVSFRKMIFAKLIVTGLLTVLFGIFSFLCTVLSAILILHCYAITSVGLGRSLIQICGIALANFLAVSPLIAWFGKRRGSFFAGVAIAFFYGFCGIFAAGRKLTDLYPVTAGLNLVGYTGQEKMVNQPLVGGIVLILMIIITLVIIAFAPTYDRVMSVPQKGGKKNRR